MIPNPRRITRRRLARWALHRGKGVAQRIAAPHRRGPALHVFVAGVQRSGTNMLMQALDRSLHTDVYHESDSRAFVGYEMRDPDVVARLVRRSPARVFVIKALCELQDLPELMARFQPARTLWLYRNYRDVANSMTASFKSVPTTVHRLAHEGEAVGWWGRGMSRTTQDFLRRVVERDPNPETSAALLWYLRNRLFFELGLDRDERVLPIEYEGLVTEPQRVLGQVARFLGIPESGGLSQGIHARSIGRRSEPAIDPEVSEACDRLLGSFDTARLASEGQLGMAGDG